MMQRETPVCSIKTPGSFAYSAVEGKDPWVCREVLEVVFSKTPPKITLVISSQKDDEAMRVELIPDSGDGNWVGWYSPEVPSNSSPLGVSPYGKELFVSLRSLMREFVEAGHTTVYVTMYEVT